MSVEIDMKVECLGKMCINYPELDISIDKLHLDSGDSEFFTNYLQCSHLARCHGIRAFIEEESKTCKSSR